MAIEMKDIMDEVRKTYHELKAKVADLDEEQRRWGELMISQGGIVPGEHRKSIEDLNGSIDRRMDALKQIQLEEKRKVLFGYDTPEGYLGGGRKSPGTKAMLKLLRSTKANNGNVPPWHILSDEEKSYVSYQHMPAERKALYAGDATAGGFFASVDFQNDLKAYQILISPMRQVAQVIQTSGEKVEYPNLMNDTSAYYASEQSTFTDSTDPTLGMLNIPVHEIRGLLKLSQQNMEDSMFPLEDFLKKRLSMKFAQREGTAFIRGSGNGQPRGIMNYNPPYNINQSYNFTATPTGKQTGLLYIPYIPSGSATTLGQGDCLITALHDLKTVYANRPTTRWCLTRATVGLLRLIKDSQNRPLWQPFAGANLPATIYDIPYIEMPDMDEVGANTFPIIIGDFDQYLIADRAGVSFSVRQLEELFALQGLVGFIARHRHGGDVLLAEAFRFIRVATT